MSLNDSKLSATATSSPTIILGISLPFSLSVSLSFSLCCELQFPLTHIPVSSFHLILSNRCPNYFHRRKIAITHINFVTVINSGHVLVPIGDESLLQAVMKKISTSSEKKRPPNFHLLELEASLKTCCNYAD